MAATAGRRLAAWLYGWLYDAGSPVLVGSARAVVLERPETKAADLLGPSSSNPRGSTVDYRNIPTPGPRRVSCDPKWVVGSVQPRRTTHALPRVRGGGDRRVRSRPPARQRRQRHSGGQRRSPGPVAGQRAVGKDTAGRVSDTDADDELAELVAALRRAGFGSEAVADIVPVKYAKLLANLGNVVEAVCGPPARRGPITEVAQEEGRACLESAGIAIDERKDRGGLVSPQEIDGQPRPAGSTWQSVQRRSMSTETDYLNGEICLLGRRLSQPTPMNDLLTRLVRVVRRDPSATFIEADVLAMAGHRERQQ